MGRIFGITGGVGMGKSTIGKLLAQSGVAVVDTDVIARQIVEPGLPALGHIVERFGAAILRPDNSLNREELARRVFSDDKARADLEAILHPPIHAIWTAEVQRWRAEGAKSKNESQVEPPKGRTTMAFGAVIIPLLFETASRSLFDATICACCSTSTQTQRLTERGWTAEQIQQRLQSQWPMEKKIAHSDYVVWTDTSLDAVGDQLDRILKRQTC